MTSNPRAIDPDSPVTEAARLMRSENVGSIPIVHDDRLIGIVTDRDIVVNVVAEQKDAQSLPVGGMASRELVTVGPDEPLDEALRLMARHQIRRLAVVEDRTRLVGILSQADVARQGDERTTGEVVEQISEPR
jgi:CBS domain-containing protein